MFLSNHRLISDVAIGVDGGQIEHSVLVVARVMPQFREEKALPVGISSRPISGHIEFLGRPQTPPPDTRITLKKLGASLKTLFGGISSFYSDHKAPNLTP